MFVRDTDHRRALALLGDAATARSRHEFTAIVLPRLRGLFTTNEATYAEISARTWRWGSTATRRLRSNCRPQRHGL